MTQNKKVAIAFAAFLAATVLLAFLVPNNLRLIGLPSLALMVYVARLGRQDYRIDADYQRGQAYGRSWLVIGAGMIILGIYIWIAKNNWLVLALAVAATACAVWLLRINERQRRRKGL